MPWNRPAGAVIVPLHFGTAMAPHTDGTAARLEPLRLTGGCHCGNLELTFETRRQPREMAVRACGCSFCRRHGVRTASDPDVRVEFLVRDPLRLSRYRFALATAEFLICRTCGVYVGALMADAGSAYAIVNINALAMPGLFTQSALAVSYDQESTAERRARRRTRWTPAAMIEQSDRGRAAELSGPTR
jgi:hypothetical protein